jgi:hypothetical protein
MSFSNEKESWAAGLGACVTALSMAFTFALPHAADAQTVTPPVVPTVATGRSCSSDSTMTDRTTRRFRRAPPRTSRSTAPT